MWIQTSACSEAQHTQAAFCTLRVSLESSPPLCTQYNPIPFSGCTAVCCVAITIMCLVMDVEFLLSKEINTASPPFFILVPPEAALQVDTLVPNATVSEKAAFQLDCSIVSRSSQDSHFAVTWYSLRTKAGEKAGSPGLEEQEDEEEEEDPAERMVLLSVGPDAVFGPEGSPWEGRLRFQRLSALLFRLTVLQASTRDTGNYSCRVEEWLPSPQKEWYRLTEGESAPIGIQVLDTGEFSGSIATAWKIKATARLWINELHSQLSWVVRVCTPVRGTEPWLLVQNWGHGSE